MPKMPMLISHLVAKRATILSSVLFVFAAGPGHACDPPLSTVFACDLVAKPERVEVCAHVRDNRTLEMTYSYGIPGTEPDLTFRAEERWGAVYHDGFFDVVDLTQFGIGLVHPNGAIYMVYAFGSYRDGVIRRGLLQAFPSVQVFDDVTGRQQSGGATFHAECQPSTILGDFEFFAP